MLRVAEEPDPRAPKRRKQARPSACRLRAILFEREIDLGDDWPERIGFVPLGGKDREGGEDQEAKDERQKQRSTST